MIKHIWSVLCRKSLIDCDSNNISLNDVFEQLDVSIKVREEKDRHEIVDINIPIEFEVISMWLKDNKKEYIKADVEIEVIDPQGKEIKVFPIQKIEMPSDKARRLRSRLKISGTVISLSGDYIFKVKIKEERQKDYRVVAELPLEVNIKKEVDSNTFKK